MDEEKKNTDLTEENDAQLSEERETAEEAIDIPANPVLAETSTGAETPEEETDEQLRSEEPEPEAPEEEGESEAVPAVEEKAECVEEATRVFSATELSAESGKTAPNGIELACALCDEVIRQVGRDGFHGGVRPDNISLQEGELRLGKPLEHGVGEFTPQELEYMSPELFWDGKRSGSTDVYSIGLVLYSVFNHGLMPFWPVGTDATPNIRAAALQRRMNREELSPPASAGAELSAIILRALAFSPEERWNDTEELKNALCDCTEEQDAAVDIRGVLTGMMERGTHRSERKSEISSPFINNIGDDMDELPDEEAEEEPIPKVTVHRSGGRLPLVLVYIALALTVVAIILLLRRCVALDEEARVTPTPPIANVKEPSESEKTISGILTEESREPEEAEPTPEPTPESTVEPVSQVQYTAYRENVSWQEAVKRCEELGGTLAMPTNYEEFQTITALCEEQGLTFVWLNAQRNAEGKWVNAAGVEEPFFFAWGVGEPSEKDIGDGVSEDYFLLWNHNGRWSGNDSRENPLTNYFNVYGGKIGFVCKTVSYESVNITDLEG